MQKSTAERAVSTAPGVCPELGLAQHALGLLAHHQGKYGVKMEMLPVIVVPLIFCEAHTCYVVVFIVTHSIPSALLAHTHKKKEVRFRLGQSVTIITYLLSRRVSSVVRIRPSALLASRNDSRR